MPRFDTQTVHRLFADRLTRVGIPAEACHLGDDWSVAVPITLDDQDAELYLRCYPQGGMDWQIETDTATAYGTWPPLRGRWGALRDHHTLNRERLRTAMRRRGATFGHHPA
ncbi:hypothetical protein [Kitasatospora sp. NPDC057595]